MTIAVSGATGKLGRLVLESLTRKVSSGDVVALARSPEKAGDLGVAVREADYDRPETLAADLPEEADLDDLKKYERELMWRIVRLTDSILQLAVTGKGAAYDDSVLQQLENTLKLAKIVQQANEV